jgi:hypothetical protein
MALVVKDRVQVSTSTTGTGTLTLGAAAGGFQDFSVIGDGNTTYYTITNNGNWEVGIGTYTASGTTLSRDTVLESSNSGNKINLSGSSVVFCTYPAEKSVDLDTAQTLTNKTIAPASVSDQANTSTGYFDLPAGTTAQRPGSPAIGMIRYNTTESKYEVYNGARWKFLNETDYPISVDFLVIAGGGGSGSDSGYYAGGGGAGGFRTSSGTSGGGGSAESALSINPSTSYTVTVGAGGAQNANGSNSVFSTVTSTGGGKGGTTDTNGVSGGSGGGAGGNDASTTGGAGTANQGYAGGNHAAASGTGAGGGGGASSVGGNAEVVTGGGTGGSGLANSLSGSSVTYAAGGGGMRGFFGFGNNGANGTGWANAANLGHGGAASVQRAGSSGVVIIKYPDAFTISNPGGGLTYSTASSGGFKVTTFTAGTGNIQLA